MQILKKNISASAILFATLAIAGILRFIFLTENSLWLDELHGVNEADPSLPLSQLFDYLVTFDPHPPLYFLLERFSFVLFGYSEWAARAVAAAAGVLTVWGMYLLGKELLNKRLGVTAAIITCLNIYNIEYSQEARGYTLLWLFTGFSYLYFIRLYKYSGTKNVIGYIISSVLLLYTHYFSLLVIFCEVLLGAVFLITDRNKKKLFLNFLIAGIIVLVLYLPWLPRLQAVSNIQSFWIGNVQPLFFFEFLYYYFANALFIFAPLIIYFFYYAAKKISLPDLRSDSISLSTVFIFVSVFFSLLVPYLRSVFGVPMLMPRYMIIILPPLILCIAYGLQLIRKDNIRNIVFVVVITISLADVFFIKKIYTPRKEQFRELTAYITANGKNYPLINELTGWHQHYYLKKYDYTGALLFANKENMVDSILRGQYKADSFWIVGLHGDPHLSEAKQQQLDAAFVKIRQKEFIKAWVELYARNPN
jgi:uncharacterized membrane protein